MMKKFINIKTYGIEMDVYIYIHDNHGIEVRINGYYPNLIMYRDRFNVPDISWKVFKKHLFRILYRYSNLRVIKNNIIELMNTNQDVHIYY